MILEQFYLECLAHASYLVVDERTGTAAVVDPRRDVDEYLAEAERLGARIEHVLLTHFHADFVAGHLELRERGARIYLGARARAEYDFTPLADGDVLEFGDVRLTVLETPGHTPEGISIVVFDLAKSDALPHAVFTGDTLFVGDVGRPDLMASVGVSADELAGALYDSLHHKLLALPDETLVYPAHGAGSMCGKNLGEETFSTIGEQRRLNYALQPMTKEQFKAVVTADQPAAPAYFGYDATMNKRERATLDETLAGVLRSLALEELLELRAGGAVVVDTRDADAYARSHLAGSVHIGLGGRFASWAGTLLAPTAKIVLISEPGTETEAAVRLGRIGMDAVTGYLEGGAAALDARPDLVATTARVPVADAAARLAGPNPPRVLDVRTPGEWEAGHIEGSLNVPLQELKDRLAEIPEDVELAVVCKSSYRSSIATSLLEANGITALVDVAGGMDAWVEGGHPATAPTGSACET